jgi:hypothetical protein
MSLFYNRNQEITKLCVRRKKEFEDVECLLVYFRIYFIIDGDISCMPTMSMYNCATAHGFKKIGPPKSQAHG